MAYQVTITTTFADIPVQPSIGDWIATQPDSVLDAYPEYAGMTPTEAFYADVAKFFGDPSEGYISEELSTTDTHSYLVTLWEDQASYNAHNLKKQYKYPAQLGDSTGTISCSTSGTSVTGTGTLFTTEYKVNDTIRANVDGSRTTIGTVASIESDTSMTLTTNAISNLTNQAFGCNPQLNFSAYMHQQYDLVYDTSTGVTVSYETV